MQPFCKDVIAQWVSAIRDFQVTHLHQPPCSTSPLLAFNYISGQFHLIPMCGTVGSISVTSHSFKSFCDTLGRCCLSPCGRTEVTWPAQMSTEKGKHPAVIDACTSPPIPLAPLGSAVGHCSQKGAEILMATAKASIPQEPSLLPASALQSLVPSTAAEAHCIMPLFKPLGFLIIEYVSGSFLIICLKTKLCS